MSKQRQISIRLNEELYKAVKKKCNDEFGVGISPFLKIFLKAFVTQKGVGFYIGDDDLSDLFRSWLRAKKVEKIRGKRNPSGAHPPFKKLFEN